MQDNTGRCERSRAEKERVLEERREKRRRRERSELGLLSPEVQNRSHRAA